MQLAYTKHLGQRLVERKITRSQVDQTVNSPDSTQQDRGATRYLKRFGNQTLTVVVTKNSHTNVVVSAWIDPPNIGTKDMRKKNLYAKYKQSKGLVKLWYGLRLSLMG
jgi:Domain of unknown function (DUF4258)